PHHFRCRPRNRRDDRRSGRRLTRADALRRGGARRTAKGRLDTQAFRDPVAFSALYSELARSNPRSTDAPVARRRTAPVPLRVARRPGAPRPEPCRLARSARAASRARRGPARSRHAGSSGLLARGRITAPDGIAREIPRASEGANGPKPGAPR